MGAKVGVDNSQVNGFIVSFSSLSVRLLAAVLVKLLSQLENTVISHTIHACLFTDTSDSLAYLRPLSDSSLSLLDVHRDTFVAYLDFSLCCQIQRRD